MAVTDRPSHPSRLPHGCRLACLGVLAALTAALFSGCGSLTYGDEVVGFSGEWCTYRSLGADGYPLPAVPFVGMTLVREGDRWLGTGTTKRAGDTIVWPSRYRGDALGSRLVLEVSELGTGEGEEPGPEFVLDLEAEGNNELVGVASGDQGFDGPIRMVRVGSRCFGQ